jgi:2-oxoglutarate dehydrogenase E2 component (dihydrolipoamide succinyltransferase)
MDDRNIPVLIPPLDLGDAELRVGAWHCRNGNSVREGDRLLEIIAGEVIVELPVPADGILRKLADEDEVVTVGQVVGEILP